eukprot:1037927-Pleurochrysis_carterae.AAC.4
MHAFVRLSPHACVQVGGPPPHRRAHNRPRTISCQDEWEGRGHVRGGGGMKTGAERRARPASFSVSSPAGPIRGTLPLGPPPSTWLLRGLLAADHRPSPFARRPLRPGDPHLPCFWICAFPAASRRLRRSVAPLML